MERRTFNKLAGFAGIGALTGGGNSFFGSELLLAEKTEKRIRNVWDRYFLGTAYYPEWWEPSEWEIDFRQMHDLGISTVRMGEFAWASYEPEPGKFQFDWMDHAIEVANRNGIDVILSTPTASVPPWLYQLHPDVLAANDRGPYTYGGRKGYCPNSQNYLDASARIANALASHYGHHPGVIGWQLDNEPGFPFACYGPTSERAFQEWLKQRYGTLKALNQAWNGAFWSNQYSDWSQVHFPTNSAEGGWQPAITLDYRRFFSDSFLNHLRQQAVILRKQCKDQFLYTNWPSPAWSVDVFEATKFLDATAWDNYCSAPGISEFQRQYVASFFDDFCRCAGPGQRFFCAEQIAYLPSNALPEGLRLQAYINLAHGGHGQLYFEWRRPLAGNEQYRPSFIKGFDGSINPEKPIFEQIVREFAHLDSHLAGATTRSDIAFFYDFTNSWAQAFGDVGDKGDKSRQYGGEVMHYYNGFKVLQRNIDVIPSSTDLSPYKVVVAPNLRLIDDATFARLQAFVTNGGILVLNYRAGTQKNDSSMRRVLPPGVFTQMAGVTAKSNVDLVENRVNTEFGISFSGNETVFHPRTILESLTLHGAEAIAAFRGGRMSGQPAITRNRHGRGWVFYVGTDSADAAFHDTLARSIGEVGNLSPLIAAPYGVEVVSRENSETIFYFFLNLTETSHNDIELPWPMEDLIKGQAGGTQISLGPLDVAVLASPKSAERKHKV